MGNTINIQQNVVFGEKEYQNFIKKYQQVKTTYDEEKNQIVELLDSANIDYNLCADIPGLRVGITLKFPALPVLPTLFDIFLPSPSLSCKVNNLLDIDISME